MVGRRVAAALIDTVLLVLVTPGIILLLQSGTATIVKVMAVVLWLAYFPVLDGVYRGTVGKRALRLRVVDEYGQPMGILRGIARTLVKAFEGIGIVALVILISRDNQSLGDMATNTFVVKRGDLAQSFPPPFR